IAGNSFLGEVQDVNDDYTAQVEFINLEDDFTSSDAHYYPLERIYSGILFAPEVGDIVEIYFKSQHEIDAAIRNTSSDQANEKVVVEGTEPAIKLVFNTERYQIEHADDYIYIADEEKNVMYEMTEEDVDIILTGSFEDFFFQLFQQRREIGRDEYEIIKEGIKLAVGDGEMKMEGEGLRCVFTGYQVNVKKELIEMG
ncbi:MAG: hypothetical protein ACOC5A_00385, partial [Halanaerobiales bacterium]